MQNPENRLMHADAMPLLARFAPKKVVVFRALQLGDMLCAVPSLRALRATLPAAHITLVGLPWAAQFVRRFPAYLDDFVAFPGHPAFPEQAVREDEMQAFYSLIRRRSYDLAIQMHGSGEISNAVVSAFGARKIAGYTPQQDGAESTSEVLVPYPDSGTEPERLVRLMEFLGAQAQGFELEFPITVEDVRELEESGLQSGLEPGRYLCIHPGARHRNKCWPPPQFAKVADRLAEEFGITVVLTGSDKEIDLTSAVAEHMRTPAINAAAFISIGAMAALMSRARLLICNDTGVSHIAAGLRLPSVVIFSTADIRRWAPLDHQLHRCLWDPEGQRVQDVLKNARDLLAA